MPIIQISSLSDPRLSDYSHQTDVQLRKSGGLSYGDPAFGLGLYLAESALVLARALAAGHQPRSILALGDSVAEAESLLARYPKYAASVPIFTGPAALIEELTGYLLHRGLTAAMIRPALPEPTEVLADSKLAVVLHNVVDPTNVGAIIRSVAAIGADAVLATPDTADPFYRRSIRVAMGSVFQVPWTRIPAWPEGAALLKSAGFQTVALALSDASVPLHKFKPAAKTALILGSEGPGLPDWVVADSDASVRIPMQRGIDSLNVAAAAAVALWAIAHPND